MKSDRRLLPLALALALLAAPAGAQDPVPAPGEPAASPTPAPPPDSPPAEMPAPVPAGPTLTGGASVAAQGGSGIDESSKLQQYETVPVGVYLESAWFRWARGDHYLRFEGTKLGLDDQFAGLRAGRERTWNLDVTWDENPNFISNAARTPYAETDPGVFRLPDGFRLANQNQYQPWVAPSSNSPSGIGSCPSNATAPCFYSFEPWVANGAPIDIRYERRTGRAALSYRKGEAWTFGVSGARESREGNKNTTFYGGTPSIEIASPIDYLTTDFRLEAEYAKGRGFANLSANFNTFTNELLYAEVDNPQRLEMMNPLHPSARPIYSDAATFRLWLPPDNDAYTVDATAGYTLPKHHKVTGSFSVGGMNMQHDTVHGLSTNPDIQLNPPNPAFSNTSPYSSIEGRYDTFMGQLKLTGDPHAKFGYIATWRKFELADETEDYTFFSSVRGDVSASVRAADDPIQRHHEGWSKQSLRAEVHVLPVSRLRLSASYGQDDFEYDRREYEDVTDQVLQLTADYGVSTVNVHLAYTNTSRDPGTEAIHPPWQGATQTDLSERDRNQWSGFLTWMPNATVALSVNASHQTNDFPNSQTGVLDQTFDGYGFDATWTPNATFSAYGGYVYEEFFFDMAAAYIPRGQTIPGDFDPRNDPNYWENETEDRIDTFRVGFEWMPRPERIQVTASLDYTKPRSDSEYEFVPGGAGEANGAWPASPFTGFTSSTFTGFPQVSKDFLIAKVQLDYHVMKNLTATALYWKQKFDNVDWQTNVVWPNGNGGIDHELQPYMGHVDPSANRWLFLGAQVPSYDADIFRVALTYTF
jgi:hypothetical protein